MPCNKCGGTHQQTFKGELAIAFPGKERVNLAPIYVSQNTVVCLDCGYTELVIPTTELEKLKKGMEGFHSTSANA
jgi:predicted nucleic-acid-binding Zn-ribbon protein